MIVAGIDPSLTSCGIALLRNGQPQLLTTIGHPGHNSAHYNHRSDRIVSQCRAVIDAITDVTNPRNGFTQKTHIDLAVIEGPAYGTNLPSNHDRAGLWWGLYSALRAKKIPTAVVAPGTRAKWATGHGQAAKTDVLAAVRAWWPNTTIRNHDIADAACLALIGAFRLGDKIPFEPKPRHHLSLDAISWPEAITA
jgi:Holliday junction resolvasome RuvABC endonuclease subunit